MALSRELEIASQKNKSRRDEIMVRFGNRKSEIARRESGVARRGEVRGKRREVTSPIGAKLW